MTIRAYRWTAQFYFVAAESFAVAHFASAEYSFEHEYTALRVWHNILPFHDWIWRNDLYECCFEEADIGINLSRNTAWPDWPIC